MLSVPSAHCLSRQEVRLNNWRIPPTFKNCALFSDLWVCHSTYLTQGAALQSTDLSPLCVLHPWPETLFLFSALSLTLSRCLQPQLYSVLPSWPLAGVSGQTSCCGKISCLYRVDWEQLNLWKVQSSKKTNIYKIQPLLPFYRLVSNEIKRNIWSLWSLLPCAAPDHWKLSIRQTWTHTICEVQIMFSTNKLMLSLFQ